MPLHRAGLVSKLSLQQGEPEQAESLPYERVLKWDASQPRDASGRWTGTGGGRRGGTAGPPTEDAFGRPLGGKSKGQLIAEELAGRAGSALGGIARNLVEKLPTNLKNKIVEAVGPNTSPYAMRHATIPGAVTGAYRPAINPATATALPQTLEYPSCRQSRSRSCKCCGCSGLHEYRGQTSSISDTKVPALCPRDFCSDCTD